ncbi:MAG: GGDEF domain-containing protein [Eubacterium sp.]|nr:GGDEF domain-containing protein [Eubacterium sp.]
MHKDNIIDRLTNACKSYKGTLMLINMDNFQLFNDIYGRELGDKFLEKCASIIDNVTHNDVIKGRLGGDEFILFCKGLSNKDEIASMLRRINKGIDQAAQNLLGEDSNVSVGVSIGAVTVPDHGTDYKDLFQKADVALEYVKQTGSHGCAFYDKEDTGAEEIEAITRGLEEKQEGRGALWLGYGNFSIVYRFLKRYIQAYNGTACKVLVTIDVDESVTDKDEYDRIIKNYGMIINQVLRRSDLMMQSRSNQFFLLLPELHEEYLHKIYSRIESRWNMTGMSKLTKIHYKASPIIPKEESEP